MPPVELSYREEQASILGSSPREKAKQAEGRLRQRPHVLHVWLQF